MSATSEPSVHADVIVWGYLACVKRLQVAQLPRAPMEGTRGRLVTPTIKCDAPLVGLSLAAAAANVLGAFNSPGNDDLAAKTQQFVCGRLPNHIIGPQAAPSFEFQIVSSKGEVRWFSDPESGLGSLKQVNLKNKSCRWLYIDGFDWLKEALDGSFSPAVSDGIFINLGTIPMNAIIDEVSYWSGIHPHRNVVIQISAGESAKTSDDLIAFAEGASGSNAVAAIVTGGARGLALVEQGKIVYSEAKAIPEGHFIDTAGAGAAVSAAYLLQKLSPTVIEMSDLALALNAAGQTQCSVPGAIGEPSWKDWARLHKDTDNVSAHC